MIKYLSRHAKRARYLHCASIGKGDVSGVLALDSTNKLIVLAFRGSRGIQNWLQNLDFVKEDGSSLCNGCEVHKGFFDSWNSVSEKLSSELSSASKANPDYGIVAAGHSLGAALATLAAVALRNSGTKIDLVGFFFFFFFFVLTDESELTLVSIPMAALV